MSILGLSQNSERVRLIAVLLCFCFVGACKTTSKNKGGTSQTITIVEHTAATPASGMPEALRTALELFNHEQYEEALSSIDGFIQKESTSPYTQAAQLNAGRALEGLERWTEAIERYRSVAVVCDGVAPRLQAMALYRLSFCHEAKNDYQQAVATLVDVAKRATYLPPEIADAELPARLAAAYARVGNFDKALEFYKTAERGIVRLKRVAASQGGSVPEWLPRTLYFMGIMAFRGVSWDDFESSLRPLAYGQTYLLEAAELGTDPWSSRAARDLMASYRDLWRAIEVAPMPEMADPILSRRQVQVQQWARSGMILEHLRELRARVAPKSSGSAAASSSQVRDILEFVSDLEKKIEIKLTERPAGEGLTPEALERRSSIRGRVVAPDSGQDTELERKFIESARASRLSTPVPAPTLPESPPENTKKLPPKKIEILPPQDPNL